MRDKIEIIARRADGKLEVLETVHKGKSSTQEFEDRANTIQAIYQRSLNQVHWSYSDGTHNKATN